MRWLNFAGFGAALLLVVTAPAAGQGLGLGTRLANLPVLNRSTQSPPQSATQPAAPRAPRESQLTFEPSSLAPQASVSIPAATSPAGNIEHARAKEIPQFGSRLRAAAANTREALTIKPREIPADDPLRLSSTPPKAEAPVFAAAARVFEGQGQMDRARQHYEKALAIDVNHLEALVGLARLQHREGDLAAATQLYQRALKAHPNNPIVLNDLGLCYARRGMAQQAEQSLRQAVQHDARSKLYRNNLAMVLVENGREDEALGHLAAAHGEAVAHYNLAYMLREKGRADDAAEHLQTALRLDPKLEPARQLLASLQPADAARHVVPVRMRVDDAAQRHPAGGQRPASVEPALRRAPVPGDLPEYMRRDASAANPAPSRWSD